MPRERRRMVTTKPAGVIAALREHRARPDELLARRVPEPDGDEDGVDGVGEDEPVGDLRYRRRVDHDDVRVEMELGEDVRDRVGLEQVGKASVLGMSRQQPQPVAERRHRHERVLDPDRAEEDAREGGAARGDAEERADHRPAQVAVCEHDAEPEFASEVARFVAVIVLPSPGTALVTRIVSGNEPPGPATARFARSVRYASRTSPGSGSLPVR